MKACFLPGLNRVMIGIIGLALLLSLFSCTVESPTAETFPTPLTPTPSSTLAVAAPTVTPSPGFDSSWTRFSASDALAEVRNLQAIAIAPDDVDGTLWLGTDRGLRRFDGARWETHTALGRGISVDVLSLAVGPAGGLWAGTREGLTRFDGRTWTPYRRRDYCDRAYCPKLKWNFAIAVAPDGALWLSDGWKLHRFDGALWTTHKPHPFAQEDEQDFETLIEALTITPDGDVWFGTDGGAYHLADDALALTGESTGWRYADDGSFYLLDRTPVHYTIADGLPSDRVNAIAVALDGAVWFGTDRGAARFDGQGWQTVSTANGLPHNDVTDIAVAPDGALWFLTEGGIARYVTADLAVAQARPSPVCTPIPTCTPTPTPLPTRTPVPPTPTPTPTPLPDMFRPVAAVEEILPGAFQRLHIAPDGELWMVTERAVAQRVDEAWQVRLSEADFGAESGGQIVGIDAAERIWVASEDTGEIASWDGTGWILYSADAGWTPVGDAEAWYRAIAWGQTDRQGRFWLATSADVRAFDGGEWTVYAPEDMGMGPPEDEELFHDFHVAPMAHSDQVWVGACEWAGPGPVGGRGVRTFDGQAWQGADSPVASGCALAIEEDGQGRVWMGVGGDLWRYDPAADDWAHFTPPEDLPGEGWRRYGAVTGISLDAAGDPWVTLLLCGGASCDTEALYHVQEGAWTQVGELGVYAGPVIEIDTIDTIDGAPWLFGGGIHRVEGQTLEMVAPWLVQSVVRDGAGRVWFVARHQGADWLWTVNQER